MKTWNPPVRSCRFTQPNQVIDSVKGILDVAVEHRALVRKSQLRGRSRWMLQPLVGVRLVLAQFDHGPPDEKSRRHLRACSLSPDIFACLPAPSAFDFLVCELEPVDLDRGPRLQMDLRVVRVQQLDAEMTVPLVRPFVVQTANDVHFRAARDRSPHSARAQGSARQTSRRPFGSRKSLRKAQNRQR